LLRGASRTQIEIEDEDKGEEGAGAGQMSQLSEDLPPEGKFRFA